MEVINISKIDKKRSKIEFDSGIIFALYNGEIYKLEIKEGITLDEAFYAAKIVPILKSRIKERTIHILKSRDRTEKELRDKLREGFYPEEIIDYVIDWAKSHRYIDDERYVEFYIESNVSKKSKNRMLHELRQKGISKEYLEDIFEEYEIDEKEQIKKFLEKKNIDVENLDFKAKGKILNQLLGKGYSYENIMRCL